MLYTVVCLALLPCLMASPMLEMMEMTKARHINQIVDQGAPIEHIFKAFVETHGKTYKNEDEVTMRKAILQVNVEHIKSHNVLYAKGEKSYYLGVNQFSDLTHNEFLSQYTGHIKRNIQTNATTYLSPAFVTLPDTVDWRTKGYVTPVKNQGQCGSCWAFSTTGSLEGQNFKKKGKLTSLSEQQLVDCSGSFGNEGCNGGLMDQGFEYIKSIQGIEDEADYPYVAEQENKCYYKPKEEKAEVTGFVDVESGSEDKLKEAVGTVGPISIAIDASHSSFQSYAGGVYDEPECSSSELDHGVLVVGYGTDEGSDYWLVKNSWGETWGKEGYVQMSRNKDNQCGVATQASYPLV